jgi:hypothetical protein
MIKPLKDRIKECINIRSKMNELGISELASIEEYNNIMNHYIRTGEPKTGKIVINEINRTLYYTFTDDSQECTVTLKVNTDVVN